MTARFHALRFAARFTPISSTNPRRSTVTSSSSEVTTDPVASDMDHSSAGNLGWAEVPQARQPQQSACFHTRLTAPRPHPWGVASPVFPDDRTLSTGMVSGCGTDAGSGTGPRRADDPARERGLRWTQQRERAANGASLLVLLAGFVGIISGVLPPETNRLRLVNDTLGLPAVNAAAAGSVGLGIVLILVARGLRRHQR